MGTTTETHTQGAGDSRPPALEEDVPVRGGLFLMLAAWLLVIEGIHALVTLLEDVMNGGDSWPTWAYVVVAAFAFGGAGTLYTSRRWGYFAAAALAAVAGFAVFPPFVGGFAIFSIVVLALLALGFRAMGSFEAIQLASAKLPWRLKLTVVQVVLAVVLFRVFLAVEFDLEWIRENWWNIVSKGLPLTLLISFLAIFLAIVLALFGALSRLSRNPVSFGIAGFYTSFFRGTPLLVQIFLIYFGLSEIGVRMRGTPLESVGGVLILDTVPAAVLAIGLNYGAYMTEIFRAGIQSVGHGQAEAADALGMSYGLRMRRIVLPQAIRVIIPPTGNEFIAMTKDSSLAFTIGALELFRRADLAGRADFRGFEAYLVAAAFYWILTGILTFFQVRLERKMSAGYVRAEATGAKVARKRTFLPKGTPVGDKVTFVQGAGAGMGGGAGGSLIIERDDGSTRSVGLDGVTSSLDDEDEEEQP
jgi:polar amino acid transport system permease protein